MPHLTRITRANIPFLFLMLIIGICYGGSLILFLKGYDLKTINLGHIHEKASAQHLLGTDHLGRDILSRLIFGGALSLSFALVTGFFCTLIGTVLGVLSAYCPPMIDKLIFKITDFMIALPLLPFLIICSFIDVSEIPILSPLQSLPYFGLMKIMILFILVGWIQITRTVRGATFQALKSDSILAAKALGLSPFSIIFKHILPVIKPTITISFTLLTSQLILLESSLSFLGVGIQPPLPSWGNMLTHAKDTLWSRPVLALYPGLLILVTVLLLQLAFEAKEAKTRRPQWL